MLPELEFNEDSSTLPHGQQLDRVARVIGNVMFAALVATTLIIMAEVVSVAFTAPPPLGWTTTAKVISVHDGDTLTVEVSKRFNVRLLSCWSPELNQEGGPEARENLKRLTEGQEVTLHIQGNADFAKVTTMSRVLGRVWVGDVDISEAQRKAGHATAEKQKEPK